MAHKPSPESIKNFMASHTALLRIGSYDELAEKVKSGKGFELPSYMINAVVDDKVGFSAYLEVDALPPVGEDGFFYILPDGAMVIWDSETASYVSIAGVSVSVDANLDPTSMHAIANKPVALKFGEVDNKLEELKNGPIYKTSATLSDTIESSTTLTLSDLPGATDDKIVINKTTVYDAAGTVAVITAKSGSNYTATTMAVAGEGRIYTFTNTLNASSEVIGWSVEDSEGNTFSHTDAGEANVIEVIYDSEGNPLVIDPTDKSVTLPETGDSYTFEDLIDASDNVIGWQVKDSDDQVIYTYTDINTAYEFEDIKNTNNKVVGFTVTGSDSSTYTFRADSDGTYGTSENLSSTIGATTTIALSTVSGLTAAKLTIGETLVYDPRGNVGVVTAQSGANITTTTITTTGSGSDGTYKTTATLNADVDGTESVAISNITGLIADNIVIGETLVYDANGTVGKISSVSGSTATITTITNTGEKSDGIYKTTATLDTDIDDTTTVTAAQAPSLTIADVVIGETMLYDAAGTVAVVTAKAADNSTVTAKTFCISAPIEEDGCYKTSGLLDRGISQTTTVPANTVTGLNTADDVVVNETLIFDRDGTIGRVTAVSGTNLTVETITISPQTRTGVRLGAVNDYTDLPATVAAATALGWQTPFAGDYAYVREDSSHDNHLAEWLIASIDASDNLTWSYSHSLNAGNYVVDIYKADGTTMITKNVDGTVNMPYKEFTFADTVDSLTSEVTGWKVTANDGTTSTDIYTYTNPTTDESDGSYSTSSTLSTTIGATTSVAIANISGIDADEIVIGETLVYDAQGTVGNITAKSGTNVTVTTMTCAGHTIQNDTGTDMAAEPNLQFVNTKVTDDSTNGVTKVEVEKLTQADIDEIVDDLDYNPYYIYETYSTAETRVGTWIDGKPLYRKVITDLNVSFTGNTWVSIPNSTIPNIERIIEGRVSRADSNETTVIGTIAIKYDKSSSTLQGFAATTFASCDTITLMYTKTTD